MKTIWKFEITVGDIISIDMPVSSEILTIQSQHGIPMMWAVVEPNNITERRYFEIFGTGHNIPNLDEDKERKYIGTFQVHVGNLIFHAFELKTKGIKLNNGLIKIAEKNI